MRTTTLHRTKDYVSRDVQLGRGAPSPNGGRPGRAEGDRGARDHAVFGQPRIDTERARAARAFDTAKRRAAEREAAIARAGAMMEARTEVAGERYIAEEDREAVVRIMVQRGLSAGDAYEVLAAASPSMPVGGRGGRMGGR